MRRFLAPFLTLFAQGGRPFPGAGQRAAKLDPWQEKGHIFNRFFAIGLFDMTPFERIQAKSAALQTLGLGHYSDAIEIRDAWRRIAFETHPDRASGRRAEFERAKSAYDFLRREMPEAALEAAPDMDAAPAGVATRPRLRTRTERLSPVAAAECRALLDARRSERAEAGACQDHVPVEICRRGRHVTYLFTAPLARGENRLAMPANEMGGRRGAGPVLFTLRSATGGAGEVALGEAQRAQLFPGAKSVLLRFAGA